LEIKTGFDIKEAGWFTRKGLRTVGIANAYPLYVEKVLPGGPAERAGLQKGDIIEQLNGQALYTVLPLDEAVEKGIGQPMHLTVKRKGAAVQMDVVPTKPEKPAAIPEGYEEIAHSGIIFGAPDPRVVHPSVAEQIINAATAVQRTFGGLFNSVFRSKGDITIQQMGGPVKIISTYAMLFQESEGWRRVLWFSVLLNVNLALMNLIPLPVFDGGHIVMAIGGWIRRGSLMPIKVMEIVQTACVVCLLGLFAYLTWYDSWDLAGGKGKKKEDSKFKIEDIVYPSAK
jgi:regulator of sigma E protease